jgi:hypothetical protein
MADFKICYAMCEEAGVERFAWHITTRRDGSIYEDYVFDIEGLKPYMDRTFIALYWRAVLKLESDPYWLGTSTTTTYASVTHPKHRVQKGLFWVIDEDGERRLLTYAVECDKNGVATGTSPAYNSKKGDSFSHERSWAEAAKGMHGRIRGKPWNHYPRGRVEVKDEKATVYFNPVLLEWDRFELVVFEKFRLFGFPVVFAPDYSEHYESGMERLRGEE